MPKREDETQEEHDETVAGLLYFSRILSENKPDNGEEDNFKNNSCARFRFALWLIPELRERLSYFWFADGPVFPPDQFEWYTDGKMKWLWNENGECEECMNRSACYDEHLKGINYFKEGEDGKGDS